MLPLAAGIFSMLTKISIFTDFFSFEMSLHIASEDNSQEKAHSYGVH